MQTCYFSGTSCLKRVTQLFCMATHHDTTSSEADLGLLAGGSQSVMVICHSTYKVGGGGATHVSFYLHNG